MPTEEFPDDIDSKELIVGVLTAKQWHMLRILLICYESRCGTIAEQSTREQDERQHRRFEKSFKNILAGGPLLS